MRQFFSSLDPSETGKLLNYTYINLVSCSAGGRLQLESIIFYTCKKLVHLLNERPSWSRNAHCHRPVRSADTNYLSPINQSINAEPCFTIQSRIGPRESTNEQFERSTRLPWPLFWPFIISRVERHFVTFPTQSAYQEPCCKLCNHCWKFFLLNM
jgi:hypothetical protein